MQGISEVKETHTAEHNGRSTKPKLDIEFQIQENSTEFGDTSTATLDDDKPKQHSIVTILSIWSTMMGTSLLTMPWAIKQAGLATGIVLLIAMAGLMAYTSYIVITMGSRIGEKAVSEFTDIVRIFLGRFAETVALLCSVVVFLGAAIVFWILMANYLYNIVLFIYREIHPNTSNQTSGGDFQNVVCDNYTSDSVDLPESFEKAWNKTDTIPIFLVLLIFPLINFKSPTFFTKFNALGAMSVLYLLVLVSVKAAQWGFHTDFEYPSSPHYIEHFELSFPVLSGVAFLGYYLHNAILTIMRNQRHPENNTRDLLIAYSMVCFTYLFTGILFYTTFPMDKGCVADNLLNNFTSTDVMAFIARIALFFQITCVLPLVMYVIRSQILQFLFSSVWPSVKHVVALNVLQVSICVLFATFLPKIGRIISFVGALCGVSYAIALPCLVYLVSEHQRGTLTRLKLAFHCLLITLGVVNFIAQFLVVGLT